MTLTTDRIGLSTARFEQAGSSFAEDLGREHSVALIDSARRLGISVIDTASVYGESESILGRTLTMTDEFRIATKVPPLREPAIGSRQIDLVRRVFNRSLQRLAMPKVDSLLVHHADDLLVDGAEWLWEVLTEFIDQGKAERIGVAVESPHQLSVICDAFPVDLVQIPLNILDQRMPDSGLLEDLQQSGVEVHARSPFFGGVLLSKPDELSDDYSSLVSRLKRYHQFRMGHNLTAVKAALGFVLSLPIDCVIVQPADVSEFESIIQAAGSLPAEFPDFSEFACEDERLIRRTQWAA